MGEWRFLFLTMAVMTMMFSSREMMPRIRKTCRQKTNKKKHIKQQRSSTNTHPLTRRHTHRPPLRCGPAHTLQVLGWWSCRVGAKGGTCSSGDSMPRWSYPAAPPPGTLCCLTRSYWLWFWSRSLQLGLHAIFRQADRKQKSL